MKWISVDDELPMTYVDVLVYPPHDMAYTNKITAELQHDGKWLVDYEDSHQSYQQEVTGVTHWMPLPEPPNKHA